MTTRQVFVDGKPLVMSRRIGRGGEGDVYALGDGKSAVKLYTTSDRLAREPKIEALIRSGAHEHTKLVAFPTAIARYKNGEFAGFVMDLVSGHKPMFELYAPGARKRHFPTANYPFLVRTASNFARAVAKVHEIGCVIGDINAPGILISDKATVALIDADSFQFTEGNRQFLCKVGTPEYTPPEFQGQRLDGIARTEGNDAFGLAAIIFQLLFMGKHPFAGDYARGEMPVDKAIAEKRFVFSQRLDVQMTPPPGSPRLNDFPKIVATAFELAFHGRPEARPSAKTWVEVLAAFEKQLVVCRTNKMHAYSSDASACPWCKMENALGLILFFEPLASNQPNFDPGKGGFDIKRAWAAIESVRLPPPESWQPVPQQVSVSPSAAVKAVVDARASGKLQAYGIGAAVFATAVIVLIAVPGLFFIWGPLFYCSFKIAFSSDAASSSKVEELSRQYRAIDSRWPNAVTEWGQRCGLAQIYKFRDDLDVAFSDYGRLSSDHRAETEKYQRERRERQLLDFLDRFEIRAAKIKGVGPAKKSTLASYSIETAADIRKRGVMHVPGFGPVTSRPLVSWMQGHEKKFVYRSETTDVDRQEMSRINATYTRKEAELRTKLHSGAQELNSLLGAALQRAAAPDPIINALHREKEQLKADLLFLGAAIPTTYSPAAVAVRPAPPPRTVRPTAQPPAPPQATGTPNCPQCGSIMLRRMARRGHRSGRYFWGCSTYPRCTATINI